VGSKSKLTMETAQSSSDEFREFPGWKVGRENRIYKVDGDLVHIQITGWASEETIAAHEAGDESVWPMFTFEASRYYGRGKPVHNLAGGVIPAEEMAAYRRKHYTSGAAEAAMGVVLERVEACL
jgi:hypothetical protein